MDMTIPLWTLLAFGAWTLLTLGNTVGVSRWSRILTGRAKFSDFAEYEISGPGIHRRGLRAHANCVENLPVFASIVVVLTFSGCDCTAADVLCLMVIGARVPQTIVHVAFEQKDAAVVFRSLFYNIQWLAMIVLIVVIAVSATA